MNVNYAWGAKRIVFLFVWSISTSFATGDPSLLDCTLPVRNILREAMALAERTGGLCLEPIHILSVMAMRENDPVALVMQMAEVDSHLVETRAKALLDNLPKRGNQHQISASEAYLAVLRHARSDAKNSGFDFIGIEHLMNSLINTSGVTSALLTEVGAKSIETGRRARKESVAAMPESSQVPTEFRPYISDLLHLARQGKLSPVIGRDDEIERVIAALGRKKKNFPVLVGEPGVGKTAIMEGLVLRIAESESDIPGSLREAQHWLLNLHALTAGTPYRGQFEERARRLFKYIEEWQGGIVLYIDEIHTLIGAGQAEGALDLAQFLKPMLADGSLRVVGATTLDEYRKYIEKDAALERRAQPVRVEAPSRETTKRILNSPRIRVAYEAHYGVAFSDAALDAVVEMAERYITQRFFPDKAFDVLEEAAGLVKANRQGPQYRIRRLQERIGELREERRKKFADSEYGAEFRANELQGEIFDLESRIASLTAKWNVGQILRRSIEELEGVVSVENLQRRIARAATGAEFDDERPSSFADLKSKRAELKALTDLNPELAFEVGVRQVALAVENITGIKTGNLVQSEKVKLANLEETIGLRVRDQTEAVRTAASAIRTGLTYGDPEKPRARLFLVGDTGVGKTQLAKAIAETLYGSQDALIRIDMSEYMDRQNVSRLIGSPPGLVGYEEGGQLTEKVRRRPYCVVLLDEIDKAAPEVMNLLLQVLDEGRLTDGQGRTVNFRHAIIMATSNFTPEQLATLRPELKGRWGDFVPFRRLGVEGFRSIADLHLEPVLQRFRKNGIEVEVREEVKSFLAEESARGSAGARRVEQLIEWWVTRPVVDTDFRERALQGHRVLIYLNADGVPEGRAVPSDGCERPFISVRGGEPQTRELKIVIPPAPRSW